VVKAAPALKTNTKQGAREDVAVWETLDFTVNILEFAEKSKCCKY
jgi:hypothetical protein